jgi:hypothetical protein
VLAAHRIAGLVAASAACLIPARAAAWASSEHQEIGREGYLRACDDVAAIVAARQPPPSPPGVAARLELACGRNRATLADVYADACAIAGDFLSEPSEFMSLSGAWRWTSKKSYLLLALENSQHFNPMATKEWAKYHAQAVSEALAGAGAEGLAMVERFQLMLQESAFSDHFMQDAFAAGHMGFNRTATSAAAAKSFHDSWNVRGRVVSSRAGDRWVTFGDERLDSPDNQDGRRHVMDAAALSVRNVLRAFVLGERAPDEELAIFGALPFAIEAPEKHVGVVEIFERGKDWGDRQLVPLVNTVRPARRDTVLVGSVWNAAPFTHPDGDVLAVVGGFELAVPLVPAQTYLGAGATLLEPDGTHAFVGDTGVVVPFEVSLGTLMSHQLNATVSWLVRHRLRAVAHVEYQMNLELGDVLVNLHVGLAEFFPNPSPGWYAAAGLGYVFSAAGGGAF